MTSKGRTPAPPAVRFWRFVSKGTGCWLWTGGTNGKYGVFWTGSKRRRMYAHRFSYELHVGPIPDGLVINHLCITPLCVRPDHLEATTYKANSRYGNGPAAQRARQATCIHGHPLDAVRPNGTRRCNTCARDKMRRRRTDPDRPKCSANNCSKIAVTRGLCPAHYFHVWKAENQSKP